MFSDEPVEQWLGSRVLDLLSQREEGSSTAVSTMGFLHHSFELSDSPYRCVTPLLAYDEVTWEDFSAILHSEGLTFELNERDEKMLRLLTKDPNLVVDESVASFAYPSIHYSNLRRYIYTAALERIPEDCHPNELGLRVVIGMHSPSLVALPSSYVSLVNAYAFNTTFPDQYHYGVSLTDLSSANRVAKFASHLGSDLGLCRILSSLKHYCSATGELLKKRKHDVIEIMVESGCNNGVATEIAIGAIKCAASSLMRLYSMSEENAKLVCDLIRNRPSFSRSIEGAETFANAIEKYLLSCQQ